MSVVAPLHLPRTASFAFALLAACASEVRIDPHGRGAGAGVGGDDTIAVSTASTPAAGNASANASGNGGAGDATSIASSTSTASSGAGGEGGARIDCGDGRCEIPETCSICPDDCQVCSEPCGDGICQEGDEVSCWQDCQKQPTTSASTGPQVCPPAPCEPGGEANAACTDPCVIIVCAVTPACCEGAWGPECADTARIATESGFCFCDG